MKNPQLGCSVENCNRPHAALGYCDPHYRQFKRNGQTGEIATTPLLAHHLTLDDRILIWKETSTTNEQGCWLWHGRQSNGYGYVAYKGRGRLLHKLVWERVNGPVPEGKELHHECRHRNCWNPQHLTPKTRAEHELEHLKTHCSKGHEYSPENTYYSPTGARYCRACSRQAVKDYRTKTRRRIRNDR